MDRLIHCIHNVKSPLSSYKCSVGCQGTHCNEILP